MTPALSADYVRLTLWRDRITKGLQLAIESDSDPGGYRIFGPSFIGDSERLVTHTLSARDMAEIRCYLERTDG